MKKSRTDRELALITKWAKNEYPQFFRDYDLRALQHGMLFTMEYLAMKNKVVSLRRTDNKPYVYVQGDKK